MGKKYIVKLKFHNMVLLLSVILSHSSKSELNGQRTRMQDLF